MELSIKQFAQFYLNTEVKWLLHWNDGEYYGTGVLKEIRFVSENYDRPLAFWVEGGVVNPVYFGYTNVKPILRKHSSLTDEEKQFWLLRESSWMFFHTNLELRDKLVWYLQKGFDLFGLIEAGLAIDAEKIGNDGETENQR